MIDQHGVWLIVAAIAIGWIVSVVSALGRASRRLAGTVAVPGSVPVATSASPAPRAQIAAAPPLRPQRTPRPPASRPPAPVNASAGSERGLAVLLRDGAGIRSGVVLAEVLAPPVSLR